MRVVLRLTPGRDAERALDQVLWPVMSPFGNHPIWPFRTMFIA